MEQDEMRPGLRMGVYFADTGINNINDEINDVLLIISSTRFKARCKNNDINDPLTIRRRTTLQILFWPRAKLILLTILTMQLTMDR